MKLKTILLLAVAVGCGLVAMLGVQQSMSGAGGGEAEEKISVLMAVTDIDVGEVLTPDNVAFRDVSIETAPENAVLTEEEYAERSAVVKVLANDFITLPKLSEPGVSGKSVAIPPGMRVVTVPVTDTTSHSGMLSPGDRVDVLVTYNTRTPRGQTTQTKTLLEFIEIFATGNKTASGGTGENEQKIKNVSLLLTPEQMPYVKLAEKKGTLSLSWRRKDDDEIVNVKSVDEDLMHELQGTLDKDQHGYGGYPTYDVMAQSDPEDVEQEGLRGWIDQQQEEEARARAEAEAAAAAAAAAQAQAVTVSDEPPKPMWTMEIFHGEERLLVELELPVEEPKEDAGEPKSQTGNVNPDTPPTPGGTEPVSSESASEGFDWQQLLQGLSSGA